MTEIQRFYEGQNVFITGGTGFLGKILIEKLLRSFPQIGTIYVLIRPKKGKDIKTRLDEFFRVQVFEVLEKINPNFREKIVGISGDGTKPGLGMSEEDRLLLTNEVSIIFHAAATVKFNERLSVAVAINVNAVKELIILCRACKKLKSAVYVSTAFSNCIHEKIEEKVYPAPMSFEQINTAVNAMKNKNLTLEEEEKMTKHLLGKFPNTYAFTKAIAESLINDNAKDLPICIYRFSIALSTYKEPFPGWLDTYHGLNISMAQIGVGFIHILYADPNAKCDIVPADFASNALIASVWGNHTMQRGQDEDVPVYNYVSGTDNPITWDGIRKSMVEFRKMKPTLTCVYYPCGFFTKSKIVFSILNFFFHLIPALIGDLILKLIGKKPKLYQVYSKGIKLLDIVSFFMTQEWEFETRKVQSLWNKLSEDDKKLLPFDITSFKWPEAMFIYFDSIKRFILKESTDEKTIEKARRKIQKLWIIHQVVKIIFGYLALWLIWKIISMF